MLPKIPPGTSLHIPCPLGDAGDPHPKTPGKPALNLGSAAGLRGAACPGGKAMGRNSLPGKAAVAVPTELRRGFHSFHFINKRRKNIRDGGLDIKKIQTVYFRAEFPVTTSPRFLFIHFLHLVSVDQAGQRFKLFWKDLFPKNKILANLPILLPSLQTGKYTVRALGCFFLSLFILWEHLASVTPSEKKKKQKKNPPKTPKKNPNKKTPALYILQHVKKPCWAAEPHFLP